MPFLIRDLQRLGAVAVVGLAVLVCGLSGPAQAQRGPAQVVTDTVRVEPMLQTVEVLGRVVARQSGILATRIAERVAIVEVQVGDRVERDQILVRLSDDRMASERRLRLAELNAAQARVDSQKATLAKFKQALQRQNSLRGSTAFRKDLAQDLQRDVDSSTADLAASMADLARADAQLALAEIALEDTVIRAPFPGVVTVRHAVEGSYIRIGDPLVTLLNDVELEIEADVPTTRTDGLQAGGMVDAHLQPGGHVPAVVRAVVPEENPRTRTRAVRFVPQLQDTGVKLISNQSVSVHVPVGEKRDVLTVQKDAITVQGSRNVAFVVKDGKVEARTIILGESVGQRFEVIEGLADGDEVVVRGNERLRDGDAVTTGADQTSQAPAASKG
ncbi:MAG: efflux RND transporter periplasmic adaptor subunit [Alphaproteobacteria bacterium]|nr:efflux RND transporter periplasmic adaptor subunit [Alphaproteobacteria bacterium]